MSRHLKIFARRTIPRAFYIQSTKKTLTTKRLCLFCGKPIERGEESEKQTAPDNSYNVHFHAHCTSHKPKK